MSNLAIVTVILGVIILMVRVPFVIFPKTTIKAYRFVLANNYRTRIFGIIGVVLWGMVAVFTHKSNALYANLVRSVGIVVSLGAFFIFIVFTTSTQNLANDVLNSSSKNHTSLRVLSLIPTILGAVMVYLGLCVF